MGGGGGQTKNRSLIFINPSSDKSIVDDFEYQRRQPNPEPPETGTLWATHNIIKKRQPAF